MESAQKWLDEVKSETLQQLLTSVAFETSPPGCTHIPGLDAHFFSSVSHHPSSRSSLNRGDVIEIQGPASAGKTHLLYHLIITSVMPAVYSSVDLGGWDKAVVIFDDGTFDIRRLHQLLLARLTRLLSSSLIPSTVNEINHKMATECLTKLHVFRPTSSVQLATTLLHLPAYHATHIPDHQIGLLVIDSMSAFYWPDRFTMEQTRATHEPDFVNPLQHILTALQAFRISHGPVTVLSNWGLNIQTKPSMFYKQHLHPFPPLMLPRPPNVHPASSNSIARPDSASHQLPPFLPPLMHHITLPFTPILPFAAGISLPDAKVEEKGFRKEVVDKGEVIGLVRSTGNSRIGKFVFCIGEQEVMVGDIPQTES